MDDPEIIADVKNCTICAEHLPLGPKPILSIDPRAKVVIISQAPGRLAHLSGIPWDDKSGDRLRDWLGVDQTTFYNTEHFAILPMGFCYPGKGKSGDLPPRKECAPQWHQPLLQMMPHIELTLVIGQYAQKQYLTNKRKRNLTETVRTYHEYLPDFFPLPHPSPINIRWRRKNPWYEEDIVPILQDRISKIIRV